MGDDVRAPKRSGAVRRRLRTYLFNTSDRLALVSADGPRRASWPMRFTQIVGGKRWSLSVCIFLTDKPVPARDEEAPDAR